MTVLWEEEEKKKTFFFKNSAKVNKNLRSQQNLTAIARINFGQTCLLPSSQWGAMARLYV
jgi:hypothetical protein